MRFDEDAKLVECIELLTLLMVNFGFFATFAANVDDASRFRSVDDITLLLLSSRLLVDAVVFEPKAKISLP